MRPVSATLTSRALGYTTIYTAAMVLEYMSEGIVHLVVTQAFRIEGPLVAHTPPHLVQFSPAQIAAVDTQLVIEPMAAAHDRTGCQVPVEPERLFLLLGRCGGISTIEPR